jgi:hypothetical protein
MDNGMTKRSFLRVSWVSYLGVQFALGIQWIEAIMHHEEVLPFIYGGIWLLSAGCGVYLFRRMVLQGKMNSNGK